MTGFGNPFDLPFPPDPAAEDLPEGDVPGDDHLEAVPTDYQGTRFRSRLEATWAETLDRLGVTWEYEPELITLPSGVRYLPDFRLPAIGAWLEVKGDGVPRIEKTHEFARAMACACNPLACECRWRGGEIIIVGHPPRILRRPGDYRRAWWANWSGVLGGAWFVRCDACDVTGWTSSAQCRACKAHFTGHLIAAVDLQIEMAGR